MRYTLTKKVRLLREELQMLQEPGSYVGEVVKVMGKGKVLVKVWFFMNVSDGSTGSSRREIHG